MNRIITHLSPHLDEILAIWLLKKFDPDFSEVEVAFKATSPTGGDIDLDVVDKDPNILYLGLGRGKYDEHALSKEDASNVSAASLVWKDIKDKSLAPIDPAKLSGIEKLVEFVLKDDLGQLKTIDHYLSDFSLTALWSGFSQFNRGDSNKKLAFGLPLMDYMVSYLTNIAQSEAELKKGQEFTSPWGKGVAVQSDYGTLPMIAYRHGYQVVVNITPKLGYHLILGKTDSTVDLTQAYEKAKSIDPDSDWYLHQSKRMLISGSHSAPNVKVSKLTLEQMVDLVKE